MKQHQLLPILILGLVLTSCKTDQEKAVITSVEVAKEIKSDKFYHYSIWYAFVNKVFEGTLTAEELKAQGDLGLGSYNQLDGELIMLNGVLYQAREDGTVTVAEDDAKIVYANATFFDNDESFEIKETTNYEILRTYLNEAMPGPNFFHAFKIHGDFNYMKCGGLNKQEPPFEEGLDVLIPNRPVFERENFSGTMVGFFCPEFIGNINVAAYHLHFISDDKQFAGHVMEFEAQNLTIEMDKITEYQFVLPDTEAYQKVGFDTEFQYQKK
ncbi:MAG: acetolactate decarboxylase [Saprospiraceae bacterium]